MSSEDITSTDMSTDASLEDTEVTEAPITGLYPDITARYKRGEELSDEDIDKIVEVAISVLRDILACFDFGNAPIDEYDGDDGEIILDVTAPDLAVLIGRHGRTLDSLQMMFSLLVSRKLGFRFPLVVDIEGYKSRRHDKITDIARRAASRAVKSKSSVSLQPMNAYERRLVHIALRDNDSVETHSEGVDPDRRVVISPR